jgi:nicotinamidase-related amidase
MQQPMQASDFGVALLLVDVINGFDFDGSDDLVMAASQAAPNIEALADSARESGIPVIYVNDNFGAWKSDFRAVIETCLRPDQPGRHVTRRLTPTPADYFVLKPRHSGFLGTPLEALLDHLEVNVVVLAGFATDLCVLFTALDAHARGFHVVVAGDGTAANGDDRQRSALELLSRTVKAPILGSRSLDWRAVAKPGRRRAF